MATGITLKPEPPLARRHPEWLKAKLPVGPTFVRLKSLLDQAGLHTICEEGKCPNIGECWSAGVATFMLLGDICTRRCGYCSVTTGHPLGLDLGEPPRVAQVVKMLGLKYVVVTSVNRDDLPDGGAWIFAETVRQIKKLAGCMVEVLTPDFKGDRKAIKTVVDSQPTVFAHNIETVERLFHKVRPKGSYRLSLEFLSSVKKLDPAMKTKSGIILGLGETDEEVVQTMKDLRAVGCEVLTLGQYLQPSPRHLPIARYYTPQEFEEFKEIGLELGFEHVESGPLVRSSYRADRWVRA